jgi:hypothetical protein
VSAGTIQLTVNIDLRRFRRQMSMLIQSLGLLNIRMATVTWKLSDREVGRRELALARELQAKDPHWHVQCVTTHEGRCRVVVKYLGGWS